MGAPPLCFASAPSACDVFWLLLLWVGDSVLGLWFGKGVVVLFFFVGTRPTRGHFFFPPFLSPLFPVVP